jgi:hypothetical protein
MMDWVCLSLLQLEVCHSLSSPYHHCRIGVRLTSSFASSELALQIFQVLKEVGSSHPFSAGLLVGGNDYDVEAKAVGNMYERKYRGQSEVTFVPTHISFLLFFQ